MANKQDYVDLIAGEHKDKPKFQAMVDLLVSGFVDANNADQSLISAFSLGAASGVQLDAAGAWVGVTRRLAVPVSGVYFAFDTADVGWDLGTWLGAFDSPTGLLDLPDDAFRVLIAMRVAANSWDGTAPSAAAIWSAAFGGAQQIVVQDNQDMSMTIGFFGAAMTAVQRALIMSKDLPLKPAGVGLKFYIIPVESQALFAWDIETASISGWDVGSWVVFLSP